MSASPSEWDPPPGLEVQRAVMVLQEKAQHVAVPKGLGLMKQMEGPAPSFQLKNQRSQVGTRVNAYA